MLKKSGEKIKKWAKQISLAFVVGMLFAEKVLAAAVPQPQNVTLHDMAQVIRRIFDVVIIAAGVVFIILFLVGGIQYLSSAGNDEATGKAKKLLVDAIVGLIIVLAAWAIGNWVLRQLTGQELNV